jgi:hypothetical protein
MSICQEIRDLRRAFSSFCISFIGRDDNNAAHLYAKQISGDKQRCLWMNYNLDFPADILRSDCNPID